MYQTTLPPDEAVGHILRHNLTDADGRKAFAKGRVLAADDAERLRALGLSAVPVAVLEPGDVPENEAARRLAAALCGPGLSASTPAAGRVNLLAEADGVVTVQDEALLGVNMLDGLTVATLPRHALVRARKRVATVKVIPFAVPEALLTEAESIAQASTAIIGVRPLRVLRVGVVLVGSSAARARIERGVLPAVEGRVEELGSVVAATRSVPPDEQAIAAAIEELQHNGAQLLIIVGETSIMDRDDVTPRGIRLAGGRIEHYGAPVEPGNLLLLAYLGGEAGALLPVVGAPGCVRSRDTNIVDLLLPRLLADEQITRRDIVALGHGGLLG